MLREPAAQARWSLEVPAENTAPALLIEILPDEKQVLIRGRRLGLTVREFGTFHALALNADHVVRRSDIYEFVYGRPISANDRSIDVFVRKIRRKLSMVAPEWEFIHTHFGVGYRFSAEPRMAPMSEPSGSVF